MKIIIVEDEYPIALNTELQLQTLNYEVLGIASDFTSLMEILSEDTPDVILMDINLGEGGSGIELTRKLKKIIQVPIVFVSAYSDKEVIEEALDTEPFGYLVKPYKVEDLDVAIQLARKNWLRQLETMATVQEVPRQDHLFLQSGTKVIKTNYSDILFLQALDNYTIIQTRKSKIVVSDYLSVVAKKIAFDALLQTHRSYYVNRDNIDSINGNVVHIGQFEVPISRSNRADFLNKLNLIH